MNPEIKQKWTEALRSGKYRQGRMCLRSDDRFCCLGVLCDIISPEWETIYKGTANERNVFKYGDSNYVSSLPAELQKKINIQNSELDQLINMNDLTGLNFEQIANWIDESL